MKKIIIFDFWGTLVETGVPRHIKQIQFYLNLRMPYGEFVQRFERAMMTKEYNQLTDAFEAVFKEFNARQTPELMDLCVGLWNKSWLLAKPYDETIKVLEELKKKFKLVLLSNTDCFSVNKVLDKFDMRKYFDLLILSYKIGAIKTDPICYKTIFKHFNATSEECASIGDSLFSDIVAAQEAQVEAVLIDRRDKREFHNKITNLNQLEEKWK
jgi:HAD superfamily hydrolase (TIGR01549 family)